MVLKSLFVGICTLGCLHLFANLDSIKTLQNEARESAHASRLFDSVNKLKLIIKKADDQNLKTEKCNAQISLAEIWLKADEPNKALELLYAVKPDSNSVQVLVRKYGQLASVYQSMSIASLNDELVLKNGVKATKHKADQYNDSVLYYLNLAMPIASKHKLKGELASLKNELAKLSYRTSNDLYFTERLIAESSTLFLIVNDSHNYVSALGNLIECYYKSNLQRKGDSVTNLLLPLFENEKWVGVKSDILKQRAKQTSLQRDSTEFYKWNYLAKSTQLIENERKNLKELTRIKVLYEADQLKKRADELSLYSYQQTKKSEHESGYKKTLVALLCVSFVLLLLTITLYVRETNMRKVMANSSNELKKINNKYELLLTQTNKQGREQLQMISSFVKFKHDDAKSNTEILQNLESKIYVLKAWQQYRALNWQVAEVNLFEFYSDIIAHFKVQHKDLLVVFNITHQNLMVNYDDALNFGLVLNEMICNTLENSKQSRPEAVLSITKNGDNFEYFYSDGNPKKGSEKFGYGIYLIQDLVSRVNGKNLTQGENEYSYRFGFGA